MTKEELKKELEDTINQLANITGMRVEEIKKILENADSIDDILIQATEFFNK